MANPSDSMQQQISDLVRDHRVILFMKGNRHFPQCGFSATVVKILDQLSDFKTVNVLSDPAMRDGIKAFSNWPTIPQLYVEGKFVGGCDIVREMHESGELAQVLQSDAANGASAGAPAEPPKVTVSDAAVAAFQGSLGEGEFPRLQIPANFQHELFIDERQPNDVEVQAGGIVLLLDPASARRAGGVTIDFLPGATGGFKIENPNAPPHVRPLSAKALKAMMDRGETLELIDVRTPEERAIARIDAARHLDDEGARYLAEDVPKDRTVVFHCHHGVRSRAAAERFLAQGFTRVYNLEGGIDAWSRDVDTQVAKY